MMYKEQIAEIIDGIRKECRKLNNRYRMLGTDDAFDDLMLYKAKLDSWKRLYEQARPMPPVPRRAEPLAFEPRKPDATIEEILMASSMEVRHDSISRSY